MLVKQFFFLQKKIWLFKFFQVCLRSSKNGKFKSKKQKCLNLNFFAWGIYIDYVRQKIPTCKVSEITGPPNFGPPDTNFGIWGPKEAPGGSENLKNGLGTCNYLYFDPLYTSLVHQGRNGEKLRFVPFIAFFSDTFWGWWSHLLVLYTPSPLQFGNIELKIIISAIDPSNWWDVELLEISPIVTVVKPEPLLALNSDLRAPFK